MPKKWPASVDLQASKESKGLQEQQSHTDSNTPVPRILTISSNSIGDEASCRALRSPRWGEKERNKFNLQVKRSNRRAKFAEAWSWTPYRASRTSGYRRQFPLRRRSSSRRFPRAPAWSTSAAN
jgi:hypothetical protein